MGGRWVGRDEKWGRKKGREGRSGEGRSGGKEEGIGKSRPLPIIYKTYSVYTKYNPF